MKKCTYCHTDKDLEEFYPDKRLSHGRKSRCKDCTKKIKNEWRANNQDKVKKYRKDHYEKNRDYSLEYARNYVKENREKALESKRVSGRARYYKIKDTEEFKVASLARSLLKRTLTLKKKLGTEKELGYTYDELKANIESKFSDGMSWDNWGEWHLDHIIPISQFVDNGEFDVRKINCLSNLRPLWASENYAKSDSFVLVEQYKIDEKYSKKR